jgi:hypothetical protein
MSRINRRLTYYSSIRWNDQLWKTSQGVVCLPFAGEEVQEREKKMLLTQQPPGASFPDRLLFTMCIYTLYIFIYKRTRIWHIATTIPYIYTRRGLLILQHSALVDLMPKRNRERKKRGGSWRCWRLDQQRSRTAQKKSPKETRRILNSPPALLIYDLDL